MTYRDLTDLSKTIYFQKFIKDLNLKYLLKDGVLYVKNECLLLMIYGFYIEDIIYVDFYDIKAKTKTNIERLISENNDNELIKVYNYYKENHTKPLLARAQCH